jgi:hypothetical protein
MASDSANAARAEYNQTHPTNTDEDWAQWARTPDQWGNIRKLSAYEYGGYAGGDRDEENRYQGLASAADLRAAPQMDRAAYNAQRALELQHAGAQGQGLGYYRSMIDGTGPSLAAQQQAAGLSAAGAQGQQIMGNARGAQGLIGAQNAGIGAGGAGAANAFGMGATGRAGEELGALHGYAGLAQQQRGQDLQRAGLSGEQAYRQAQLEAGQRAMNDRYNLGLETMRQGVFQQQLGAQGAGEAMNSGVASSSADLALRQQEQNQRTVENYATGAAATAGAGLSAIGTAQKNPNSAWYDGSR